MVPINMKSVNGGAPRCRSPPGRDGIAKALIASSRHISWSVPCDAAVSIRRRQPPRRWDQIEAEIEDPLAAAAAADKAAGASRSDAIKSGRCLPRHTRTTGPPVHTTRALAPCAR